MVIIITKLIDYLKHLNTKLPIHYIKSLEVNHYFASYSSETDSTSKLKHSLFLSIKHSHFIKLHLTHQLFSQSSQSTYEAPEFNNYSFNCTREEEIGRASC